MLPENESPTLLTIVAVLRLATSVAMMASPTMAAATLNALSRFTLFSLSVAVAAIAFGFLGIHKARCLLALRQRLDLQSMPLA